MIGKKINQLATELAPATTDLTIIGDPVTGVSKKITLLQIADLFATSGTVTSVAVTETGNALTITGSPITSAGTINIGFAGAATQYVRGDGQLSDFPTSSGGGSSVSYYLNSSVSQGTIGGVAYRQFNKTPIAGAGTDITVSTNGYIASYITDANDPALLEVPAGNFNCELYFSVNSNNHNPYIYAEVYKYDGTTFTLLGSSQSVPEYLTNGTTLSPYYFAVPVTATVLTITDRIAIRIYANVDGRTVTLHTENSHLCQVVTTFSKGLTSLNNLTRQVQFLATGTTGTDFNIASSTATHTFNIPTASATNRGALSSADWTTFNNKQNALTLTTTGSSGAATLVGATLNIPNYGSALTGYVPYTGATANVDLGAFDLLSRSAYLEGTASYQAGLLIKQRGLYNFVTGAYTQIVADSAVDLNIIHNQANTTRRRYALSVAALQDGDSFQYLLPRANGTIALTSDLAAYLPLAGGTMTGAIIGTTSTFANAGSGIGVEITNSSTGDGLKINHSSGRALNIVSSGSGFGIIINNSTASTSAPFTIQKQGSNVITLSDNGAANFSGQLTLGSTITNGTNTFTLPGASGTLALTSALSGMITGSGTTNYLPKFTGTSTIGNSNLINDASGNLGLGVTPSAWNLSGLNVMQVKNGFWYGYQNETSLGVNAYFDGSSWKYIASAEATRYGQNSGIHAWYTAPSGTAGNAISFTQAMTLDASGFLGIGETNPTSKLHIQSSASGGQNIRVVTSVAAGRNYMQFANGSGDMGYFGYGGADGKFYIINQLNDDMLFYTNSLLRLTIASTGAATFSSSVTIGANTFLGINTTDGADNGYLALCGAGEDGATRGGHIYLSGNERSVDAGSVVIATGNTTSGTGATAATIFRNAGAEKMRITSGGNVGIGTTSPNLIGASVGLSINNATDAVLELNRGNSRAGFLYSDATRTILAEYRNLPLIFFTNDTERMRITSGGDLLLGTTTNVGQRLRIDWAGGAGKWGMKMDASDGGAANLIEFLTAGNARGSITTNGTSVSYNTSSDYRLKQDLKDFNGLDLLTKIKTYDYEWKSDKSRSYGVIAHELQSVINYAVTGVKDGKEMQGVDYSKIVPVLIKAIQELNDKIK